MTGFDALYSFFVEYVLPSESLLGFAFVFNSVLLVVVIIIANCRLFKKMGQKPYKALIPFYNEIVMFRSLGLSIAMPVINITATLYFNVALFYLDNPVVNSIVLLIMIVTYVIVQFQKAFALSDYFGKKSSFKAGLLLLQPVFLLILAYGRSRFLKNELKEV